MSIFYNGINAHSRYFFNINLGIDLELGYTTSTMIIIAHTYYRYLTNIYVWK